MEGTNMECPKCQFDNRDGAIFCNECGYKFEIACPECNAHNRCSSKFCDQCGCKLSSPVARATKQLSFDEKIDKIQRYLPKGLTDKILSQRDSIEGERKQVTVMFCDIVGFTPLAEKLGSEETYRVMDQVYEILIHMVHDYEGTVNEFTGDGIMALFGAPIALEDAPQRAIRSAYAVHREMAKFSERLKREKQNVPTIKMRIGIHTGPVVVGTLGNDLRVEFTAVGDTVNLASRIEGLAEPASTYVTEETYKLTEGLFRFEALGKFAVKGKVEKVKAYQVIAPNTSRTRFDVSAERGLTPFIGRERELELLLEGFERAKKARGQAFSIVAEAGVGKSRLLYEFRKAVANEDITFQEGKCLSYSRGVVYHPVIDIVKSNSNIEEDDDDIKIKEKLRRDLGIIGVDEGSTLPYLLEFLSVKDSGVDPLALSREGRKDRIIDALNRCTIKTSQIRPLIMAIEDLHWVDKSSEDALKALLERIAGERIFLIFTSRPEYVHTWGAKSYHSQITLNRFSNRESIGMAARLLETDEIGSDLADLILEKTEGVPFFIEEFIRSLKDLNALEREDRTYHLAKDIQVFSIPSTIQEVIMARVDRVPEEGKNLLQTGSVIEREFSYELIKTVSGIPEKELLPSLSVLIDLEIIFERGIYPNSTFIFNHALTREVVYDSILTPKKKKLHNKIGQSIEQIYKDNLHEHYGVLAEHFINGENFESGAKYCRLAMKRAEKAVSFNDVIVYGKKQVICLEKIPNTEKLVKKIIDARTTLGLFYGQMGNFVEAKAICDPIIRLAETSDYKRRLSHIYAILGIYTALITEDVSKGLEYLKKALKIGIEIRDPLALVLANHWIGNCCLLTCEFDKGLYYNRKAIEINVAANAKWGITAIKCWTALNYFAQGNANLAHKSSLEALRIAHESGDIYSQAHAYTFHCISCYGKGYLEEAKEHALKGIDLSEKIKLTYLAYYANWILAKIYFEMRVYETAQKYSQLAIANLQNNPEIPSRFNYFKLALLKANSMMNSNIDLESMYALYDDIKFQHLKSQAQICIAEILLVLDDSFLSEAESWIKKAIISDKRNGTMLGLAKGYVVYAEFFKRREDFSKVKENLTKAIEIFNECGADGWVEKYREELSKL
jgi:class 3 adenylate cyclase/tetratricopeptide (TPR) repeat protein